MAGHRPKTDEIVLNVQDKIPLDIYICIAFVAISFCVGMVRKSELGSFLGYCSSIWIDSQYTLSGIFLSCNTLDIGYPFQKRWLVEKQHLLYFIAICMENCGKPYGVP